MKMLEFREVLIRWRDTPEDCMLATVAIQSGWYENEDDDVNIFFYFDNEAEYQECLLNGTPDFAMEEV